MHEHLLRDQILHDQRWYDQISRGRRVSSVLRWGVAVGRLEKKGARNISLDKKPLWLTLS